MTEKSSVNTRVGLIFLIGAVLAFVLGFPLATGINRQDQARLRAEVAHAQSAGPSKSAGAGEKPRAQAREGDDDSSLTLTDDQIKNAVAKADASPADAELQKKVGQGLYVYAWQTGNDSILPDVARILKRAHGLDQKDFKTTLMAADAYFLIARNGGDAKPLADARKLYEDALASKPDDAESRTKLGMTYFYDKPPDTQRAVREYRRALQSDPRQEMALQSLAAALIESGNLDEAERHLGELEQVNPSNRELPSLRAQLEQKRNAAKEKK